MLNKARKLMEQRESMIADAREVLVVLGAEDMQAMPVVNKIVINKGKIVEVQTTKEVVVDNTDTATIEMLRETIRNMNQALNDINKEHDELYKLYLKEQREKEVCEAAHAELKEQNERLEEELMKIEEENMFLEGKCFGYEQDIKRLKAKLNKQTVIYVEDEKVEEQPKQTVKPNHKVNDVKKLVNCGPSVGENEVLFVDKRRDSKHLWYGQIRIDNEIRNFHWSNELQMPTVYGVKSLASLGLANDLIRAAVKDIDAKELTKYDMAPDHPDFGGFKARHFYGALEQGAYIFLTPDAQLENGKETDIVFKGYVCDHAFIVNRSGDVFWRHYNYINSKKPFEKTPSKGYNEKQMIKDVETLADTVLAQYDKAASKYARQAHQTTQDKPQQVENTIEGLSNADISGLF